MPAMTLAPAVLSWSVWVTVKESELLSEMEKVLLPVLLTWHHTTTRMALPAVTLLDHAEEDDVTGLVEPWVKDDV